MQLLEAPLNANKYFDEWIVGLRHSVSIGAPDHLFIPRNKMKQLFLAATGLALLSGPSLAHAAEWSDTAICSGGLQSYFFLSSAPILVGNVDGWNVFRSASGATYDCKTEGSSVSLRWKNGSKNMSSTATSFSTSGDSLNIKTDLVVDTYSLSSDGSASKQ